MPAPKDEVDLDSPTDGMRNPPPALGDERGPIPPPALPRDDSTPVRAGLSGPCPGVTARGVLSG